MKSKQWAVFLRVPEPSTTDAVPALDPGWCAAKGINTASPVILRLLKVHIIPLLDEVRPLSYHFLIHDRLSGVPTDEKDHGAYIHLRMWFRKERSLWLDAPFVMVTPHEQTAPSPVAGIDYEILKSESRVHAWLHSQSMLVIDILRHHDWVDDAAMVRQMRQIMHWTANMTQMNVLL